MNVLVIVGVIIVVGVLLWLANAKFPMESTVKMILNAVVIGLLVVWLLKVFGLWAYLAHLSVGHH